MKAITHGKKFYLVYLKDLFYLLNIFMCDLCFIVNEIGFTSYADDNTPLVSGDRLDDVLDSLENASLNFSTGFLTIKWGRIPISVIYLRVLLLPKP